MLSERSKKSIADYFRAKPEIAAAYVFGSSSTGRDRAGSDIDIAIMVFGPMDGFERIKMETELSNLLNRDADLVVFANSTPLLQHQILKYGYLIYEADPKERVRQEVVSRRHYLDSQFLYKLIPTGKSHG